MKYKFEIRLKHISLLKKHTFNYQT